MKDGGDIVDLRRRTRYMWWAAGAGRSKHGGCISSWRSSRSHVRQMSALNRMRLRCCFRAHMMRSEGRLYVRRAEVSAMGPCGRWGDQGGSAVRAHRRGVERGGFWTPGRDRRELPATPCAGRVKGSGRRRGPVWSDRCNAMRTRWRRNPPDGDGAGLVSNHPATLASSRAQPARSGPNEAPRWLSRGRQ